MQSSRRSGFSKVHYKYGVMEFGLDKRVRWILQFMVYCRRAWDISRLLSGSCSLPWNSSRGRGTLAQRHFVSGKFPNCVILSAHCFLPAYCNFAGVPVVKCVVAWCWRSESFFFLSAYLLDLSLAWCQTKPAGQKPSVGVPVTFFSKRLQSVINLLATCTVHTLCKSTLWVKKNTHANYSA